MVQENISGKVFVSLGGLNDRSIDRSRLDFVFSRSVTDRA